MKRPSHAFIRHAVCSLFVLVMLAGTKSHAETMPLDVRVKPTTEGTACIEWRTHNLSKKLVDQHIRRVAPVRFDVYRSTKKQKSERVTDRPVAPQLIREKGAQEFYGIFWDRGVKPGVSYTYRVVAVDSNGKELGQSPPVDFAWHDGRPPSRVIGVSARSSDQALVLSWKPLNDPELSAYRVYRKALALPLMDRAKLGLKSDTGEAIAQVSPATTKYEDRRVKSNVLYYYRIAGVDPYSGEGDPSMPALASLLDAKPPTPPEGLHVSVEDNGAVRLSWDVSSSVDVTFYRVYRSVGSQDKPVLLKTVAAAGEKTMISSDRLDPKSPYTYYYSVDAVDGVGNSSAATKAQSLRLPDRTPPTPPVLTDLAVEEGRVRLAWVAPPDEDVAGYYVYRREAGKDSDADRLNSSPVSGLGFDDVTGVVGASYIYFVTALDGDGNESAGSRQLTQRFFGSITVAPPKQLSLEIDDSGFPKLIWTSGSEAGQEGYLVERSIGGDGEFIRISSLLREPGFTDLHPPKGDLIRYRVTAYGRDGRVSEPSTPVAWSRKDRKSPVNREDIPKNK
ncbi:MAG: hypothetical protein HY788_02585 [Deltaproteobacteria bacterium]|nr:hypothetical protein [Deltaproteobacteria bacterium]